MALTDDNGVVATMPVAPAYNGGGGFGGFGNDWGWIILLLLFANGGWGNGFGGGYGAEIYPWMNQANLTSNGFQNQATNSAISALQNSVTSGFGDVQNSLCGGFAGVTASINNGFAQAEIANNSRQIANMNQMFGVQSSLQNCCCENRAGLADLKYTVATEACADRNAISQALRDVLEANTASTQKILDQMCNDRLEAKNDRIADLERQLTMANLASSQTSQTAQLIADNTAQTQYLINRMAPYPVPAYVVENPLTPVTPTTTG